MFENSGEKIKKISIVVFWITTIVSVVLAFVLGWERNYHSYYSFSGGYYTNDFRPLYFFAFLIGVPLTSYISTLFLVAFGDLVRNSQRINEVAEKMENGNAVAAKATEDSAE